VEKEGVGVVCSEWVEVGEQVGEMWVFWVTM
jgi:hypothetical protein